MLRSLLLLGLLLARIPLAMAQPVHSDNSGRDASAHAPSLSGQTLLATIGASQTRIGYVVQAQCMAGISVIFDDQAGSLSPTILVVAGGTSDGAQGGLVTWGSMPHTGRIRIYSSDANCQMAARAW